MLADVKWKNKPLAEYKVCYAVGKWPNIKNVMIVDGVNLHCGILGNMVHGVLNDESD